MSTYDYHNVIEIKKNTELNFFLIWTGFWGYLDVFVAFW